MQWVIVIRDCVVIDDAYDKGETKNTNRRKHWFDVFHNYLKTLFECVEFDKSTYQRRIMAMQVTK